MQSEKLRGREKEERGGQVKRKIGRKKQKERMDKVESKHREKEI